MGTDKRNHIFDRLANRYMLTKLSEGLHGGQLSKSHTVELQNITTYIRFKAPEAIQHTLSMKFHILYY